MIAPLEFAGVLAIALIAWFMWDSLKAREAAIAASRAACAAEGVQFLDDTVAIESLRPVRGDEGGLRLRRVYGFEYTETGDSRQRGSIVLIGERVIVLNLALRDSVRPLPLH